MLGVPRQIAYAVPDLSAATIDSFASTTGAGPFVVAEHIELARCTIDGFDGEFDHSSAYGQWGELMVELIVEHQTRRIGPATGVHHVAFMVGSLDRAIEHCERATWPVALDATTRHGQRFVMCDARSRLGHLVELYEPSDALVKFYDHVRRLANGDRDPRITT